MTDQTNTDNALNSEFLSKRNEESKQSLARKKMTPQQEFLPMWPDDMRCMPNELLRSALFTAKNRKQPREILKLAPIYTIGTGNITYTGEELRQDDETVWLQLIHLAKEQQAGSSIEFTPYAFCKAIKWSLNGQSYNRLRTLLTRMQATALSVYSKRLSKGVSLSMIPSFEYQDIQTGQSLNRWRVQIAPQLVEIFGDVHFSRMEWEQRLKLPVGLATWLHGYLASHKDPFPIKIETIKQGAGLTTEDKSHLISTIEKALESLNNIGFITDWKIEKDLVTVKRS